MNMTELCQPSSVQGSKYKSLSLNAITRENLKLLSIVSSALDIADLFCSLHRGSQLVTHVTIVSPESAIVSYMLRTVQ